MELIGLNLVQQLGCPQLSICVKNAVVYSNEAAMLHLVKEDKPASSNVVHINQKSYGHK